MTSLMWKIILFLSISTGAINEISYQWRWTSNVIDNFVIHFNKHLLHKLLGDGREVKDYEERQGKLISVIKQKPRT